MRVELWGDEVDSIRTFDVESQRSIENLQKIEIYPAVELQSQKKQSFLEYFPTEESILFLDEPQRLIEKQMRLKRNSGERPQAGRGRAGRNAGAYSISGAGNLKPDQSVLRSGIYRAGRKMQGVKDPGNRLYSDEGCQSV